MISFVERKFQMKCIISRRCLLTVALAVSTPLPSLWLMEATAQDSGVTPGPVREGDRPVFSGSGVLGGPFNNSSSKPVFSGSGVLGDPNNMATVRYAGARSQADYDREVRTRKLLSDYSRTDDEKGRAKVLEDLTKVVSEQFEVRQESRERELKEVEEHVRKLRELHQRRATEKDQIVRDRVRQLLRDVDGLGWGDDGRLRPSLPLPSPALSPAGYDDQKPRNR
jgi:hypothetical protein